MPFDMNSIPMRHPEVRLAHVNTLFEWLDDVKDQFSLNEFTHAATKTLFLEYMRRTPNRVPIKTLQLVGTACLCLAAQLYHNSVPDLSEFAWITDGVCDEGQVIDKVHHMVNVLGGEGLCASMPRLPSRLDSQ